LRGFQDQKLPVRYSHPHVAPTLQPLREILGLSSPTQVVDIGANPLDEAPVYSPLIEAGLCAVTAFEPQTETMGAIDNPLIRILPDAVGDGTERIFRKCLHSGWSSTLSPSEKTIAVFTQFQEHARVVSEHAMQTRRLDDIDEVQSIDLLKIDIQGGELSVFSNARQKLAHAVFVDTEVSYMPLYENQPSFGEVDLELRRQGFVIHRFGEFHYAIVPPMKLNDNPWIALHQVLDGDVIYIRDYRDAANLDDDQLKQMAMIAHALYRSWDIACRCIGLLMERKAIPGDSMEAYLRIVNGLLANK
jgi:FkbM family methyltransferase